MAQDEAYRFLIGRGWSPQAAAGIIGNLIQESGRGLNTRAVHDNGTGYGIAGWRDPQPGSGRRTNLFNYTRQNGLDPSSLQGQLSFLDHELRTSEAGVGNALRAARTPQEATRAFISFERPAGWTARNPEGGHGYEGRVANAQRLFSQMSGQAPNSGSGTTINSVPSSVTTGTAPAAQSPTPQTPEDRARTWQNPMGLRVASPDNRPLTETFNAADPRGSLSAAMNNTNFTGGILGLAKAFSPQQQQREEPIQSSLGASAGADSQRMAQAQQMMATLLQQRKAQQGPQGMTGSPFGAMFGGI